ncbi:YczE/YyaS/YitT family protein [Chordicoccus furentiruminis]|uniref:YczE/YyaS/YitT family protein n=1 Tax=Chordicoccus furentiruminis TaxID=2709410 RepID=UPI0023A866C5|nr:hypothetical protein [Chordicoccus furentiruminis]
MIAAFDRRRFLIMLTGVFGMGVFLSFLVGADYGTDTSTFMNTSIAARTGLSFGTTMLLTNGLLFLIPLFRGRHLIGAGTICNMTVVGYTCDLFRYLEQRFMPADAFTAQPSRTILFATALIPFLFFTTMYMISDQGLAPFDTPPVLLSDRFHLPFFLVRMGWDGLVILIGILFGKRLTVGTVVFLFTIGPAVAAIGRWLRRALRLPEVIPNQKESKKTAS